MCQNAFGVLTHPSASFGPAVATTTHEIITTHPGNASTTNAPFKTRRVGVARAILVRATIAMAHAFPFNVYCPCIR